MTLDHVNHVYSVALPVLNFKSNVLCFSYKTLSNAIERTSINWWWECERYVFEILKWIEWVWFRLVLLLFSVTRFLCMLLSFTRILFFYLKHYRTSVHLFVMQTSLQQCGYSRSTAVFLKNHFHISCAHHIGQKLKQTQACTNTKIASKNVMSVCIYACAHLLHKTKPCYFVSHVKT